MSKKLAELLVKDRIVQPEQFKQADDAIRARQTESYVRYFIENRFLSESKLLYYLSQKFGLPSINLDKFEIKPDVVNLVPTDLIRRVHAVPIQSNKGTLVVAICDPSVLPELEGLKFKLKMNVEAVLTTYSAFDGALRKYYGGVALLGAAIDTFKKETSKDKETRNEIELVEVHNIDSGTTADDGPVITAVNSILGEAIKRGASDIHVEPYEKAFRVRMRVDGSLIEVAKFPLEMKRALVTRFKIMSRMDIAETRIPQDGRIKLKSGGKDIDFRVNSLPTLFGEKVVLRLLDKGNLKLDLMKLGFETKQLEVFKKGIYSANGMVLVTGPTGSGKTTTLYSALTELNKTTDNLSSVEDPVEYNLEGVNQTQVHKDIGLTFASVLRALLRQDPDTVLVGEIRDFETAEVAVQAALTGHLVLSTLHTNDAPSTITRLMNMGLEPFLVTSSVNTIVAQRLMRTVCSKCRQDAPVPKEKLVELGFTREAAERIRPQHGTGCQACNKTGYKGRVAVYEVLDFSNTLKESVLRGASALELRKQAIEEGMKSLRMSALTKMAEGATTLEEALSLTMEG
ncbi:MAG: type IV-A pilus assembly ATPase PilB [Bacteriovoracia bacterium]